MLAKLRMMRRVAPVQSRNHILLPAVAMKHRRIVGTGPFVCRELLDPWQDLITVSQEELEPLRLVPGLHFVACEKGVRAVGDLRNPLAHLFGIERSLGLHGKCAGHAR
jgi:hypothetical protein